MHSHDRQSKLSVAKENTSAAQDQKTYATEIIRYSNLTLLFLNMIY